MRSFLKYAAYAAGGLLLVAVIAAAVLYVVGGRKLARTYDVQPAALTIPSDSAAVARGAHLAATNGCHDCHTPTLAGQVMVDEPPFRVVASNLTRGAGGIGGRYTDADFARAIRHGVRPDGRSLLVMPSAAFHGLSDADVAALIAYLRTVEPVDHELPATEVRALGRLLTGAGQVDPAFEVRVAPARADMPPVGPTAEYGAYLASVVCQYCHGADLLGDPAPPGPPGMKPAPALLAAARWDLADFTRFFRTGLRPDGTPVDSNFMPIALTRHYSDDEVAAIHAHLGTLDGAPTAAARP